MLQTDPSAGECAVLLFLKAPEEGKVKTRLQTLFAPQIVLNLYKCFVADILHHLEHSGYPVRIYYTPSEAGASVSDWLGEAYLYRSQIGEDLGERMRNAFMETFSERFRKIVLIGADLPDLPDRLPRLAFEALNENDAVLGPAEDGGYYLIGFNADTFLPSVFHGIDWGEAEVFEKTAGALAEKSGRTYLLPMMRDLDRVEDLLAFVRRHGKNFSAAPRTLSYLESIGFGIGSPG
jgi:hypothetical protein